MSSVSAQRPRIHNGANGIVRLSDGALLIAHSSGRALYKLARGVLRQVTADQPIGAPDGLLVSKDGSLHAIDNTRANRVISLRTTDAWTTATLTAAQAWPDPAPTTMAVDGAASTSSAAASISSPKEATNSGCAGSSRSDQSDASHVVSRQSADQLPVGHSELRPAAGARRG